MPDTETVITAKHLLRFNASPLQHALLIFILLASPYLFYSMNSGITITNDGSHFALFDSLVTTGSPELQYVKQFAFNDSAKFNEKYYSDRNPGLALSTYSLYQCVRFLEKWMKPINLDPKMAPRYEDGQKSRIAIVMLVPSVCGSLLLLAIYVLVRQFGTGFYAALITALAIVFGTITFRYATVFYSHIFSMCLLTWGLIFLFSYRKNPRVLHLCCGTFLLSAAVLAEHLLILVFLPVFVYLLATRLHSLLRMPTLVLFVCAGLIPMLILMAYNFTCFESPFSIAHFHHSTDTRNHQVGTLFEFESFVKVLSNLFFGASRAEVGRQDITSLMNSSPFLYFVLGVIPLLFLQKLSLRAEHYVLLSAFCLLVLGAASFWAPYGGWDRDYRYFLAAVPLLAPFLGHTLDFLFESTDSVVIKVSKLVTLLAFAALACLSVSLQFKHIRHAMQVQYANPWMNWEAAITNMSLFIGVAVTLAAAVALLRWLLLASLDRRAQTRC